MRPENFDAIRSGLDRIEWHLASFEDYLDRVDDGAIDHFNLSDIFEYMSEANTERLLARLIRAARPGGRLAYWNMLAPRSRPPSLAQLLRPLPSVARAGFERDKAFFYSAFVVEERI